MCTYAYTYVYKYIYVVFILRQYRCTSINRGISLFSFKICFLLPYPSATSNNTITFIA